MKPKLDIGLFVDLAEFPCFYKFLHDVIIKLFCFDLQNNFLIISCKNLEIQGNSGKSTNNPMSIFGSIEESMELSRIHLAVHQSVICFTDKKVFYLFTNYLFLIFLGKLTSS